jgi:hypothetical protein
MNLRDKTLAALSRKKAGIHFRVMRYLSKASAAINSLIRSAALANESEHQQLAAANEVKSSSEAGYCIAGRRSDCLAGSHGMNNVMGTVFASCRW